MLRIERHQLILQLLTQDGSILVNDISQLSGFSRETIRRDLSELEKSGLVKRSSGGAILVNTSNSVHTSSIKITRKDVGSRETFHQRCYVKAKEKTLIAKDAIKRIKPGDVIAMDSSSSCWFLARQLPNIDIAVVTNSINIVQVVAARHLIRVIGLGGDYSEVNEDFTGETTETQVKNLTIDTSFLSCSGIDIDGGIFDEYEHRAQLKRQMILSSKKVVLLADSAKIGVSYPAKVSGFGNIDTLITDAMDDEVLKKEMIWHNVEVIITKK